VRNEIQDDKKQLPSQSNGNGVTSDGCKFGDRGSGSILCPVRTRSFIYKAIGVTSVCPHVSGVATRLSD